MWNIENIDTNSTLHLSIADTLERDIRSGRLKAGDRLPTNRELAKKLGFNLNTVSRAYTEAANRGLISAVVGKGTFVTADACLNSSVLDAQLDAAPFEMGLVRPLSLFEDDLALVVERVLRVNGTHRYMRYSEPQGLLEHRRIGADWIRRFGVDARPDSVVVAAGAQHATFSVFYSLFRHNDRIAVPFLTAPGAKAAARRLGLRLEGVPMDEEGIIPDQLEALCKRHPIKGLYAVGRMQYPTNRKMSYRRKEQIAEVILKHNLLLVENDVYAFLCGLNNQTLSSMVPRNSVYISSVSKAFYAGLRVAFISAPARFKKHIAQGIVDSVLLASPLSAAIACECISSGLADSIIQRKRLEMQNRRTIFQRRFKEHRYSCPEGSMAVWFQLPDGWNCVDFEREAAENGLQVYTAKKFAVGSTVPPNCIRIALSGPEDTLAFEKALDVLEQTLGRVSARSKG